MSNGHDPADVVANLQTRCERLSQNLTPCVDSGYIILILKLFLKKVCMSD